MRVASGAMLLLAALCGATAQAQTPKPPVRLVQRENPASREADARRPAGNAAPNGEGRPADTQQRPAGQAGGPVNVARPPQAANAPFKLTPKQQADLDKLLASWEEHSSKIDTFKCRFTRWDYDKAFGSDKSGGLRAKHWAKSNTVRPTMANSWLPK